MSKILGIGALVAAVIGTVAVWIGLGKERRERILDVVEKSITVSIPFLVKGIMEAIGLVFSAIIREGWRFVAAKYPSLPAPKNP